jgi:hypothetical protein
MKESAKKKFIFTIKLEEEAQKFIAPFMTEVNINIQKFTEAFHETFSYFFTEKNADFTQELNQFDYRINQEKNQKFQNYKNRFYDLIFEYYITEVQYIRLALFTSKITEDYKIDINKELPWTMISCLILQKTESSLSRPVEISPTELLIPLHLHRESFIVYYSGSQTPTLSKLNSFTSFAIVQGSIPEKVFLHRGKESKLDEYVLKSGRLEKVQDFQLMTKAGEEIDDILFIKDSEKFLIIVNSSILLSRTIGSSVRNELRYNRDDGDLLGLAYYREKKLVCVKSSKFIKIYNVHLQSIASFEVPGRLLCTVSTFVNFGYVVLVLDNTVIEVRLHLGPELAARSSIIADKGLIVPCANSMSKDRLDLMKNSSQYIEAVNRKFGIPDKNPIIKSRMNSFQPEIIILTENNPGAKPFMPDPRISLLQDSGKNSAFQGFNSFGNSVQRPPSIPNFPGSNVGHNMGKGNNSGGKETGLGSDNFVGTGIQNIPNLPNFPQNQNVLMNSQNLPKLPDLPVVPNLNVSGPPIPVIPSIPSVSRLETPPIQKINSNPPPIPQLPPRIPDLSSTMPKAPVLPNRSSDQLRNSFPSSSSDLKTGPPLIPNRVSMPLSGPPILPNFPNSSGNNIPPVLPIIPSSIPKSGAVVIPNIPPSMPNLPSSNQNLPPSIPNLPSSNQNLPPSMPNLPPSMPNLPSSNQNLPPSMPNLPPSIPNLPPSMPNNSSGVISPPMQNPGPFSGQNLTSSAQIPNLPPSNNVGPPKLPNLNQLNQNVGQLTNISSSNPKSEPIPIPTLPPQTPNLPLVSNPGPVFIQKLPSPNMNTSPPIIPNLVFQSSPSANIPPVPSMGPPVPNMGPPVPNMGPPVPNMGHSVPNMGPPIPNMGPPVLPSMGPPAPNMGLPVLPSMGPPALPKIGPALSNMGPPDPNLKPFSISETTPINENSVILSQSSPKDETLSAEFPPFSGTNEISSPIQSYVSDMYPTSVNEAKEESSDSSSSDSNEGPSSDSIESDVEE